MDLQTTIITLASQISCHYIVRIHWRRVSSSCSTRGLCFAGGKRGKVILLGGGANLQSLDGTASRGNLEPPSKEHRTSQRIRLPMPLQLFHL